MFIKNKNGFTLFELLVSISIIGIMTALAVVSYSGAQKKARDSRRIEDMKMIQTAAEQYYTQNLYIYPSSTLTTGWTGYGGQVILNAFPIDPKNDFPNGYYYTYSVGGTYCACAKVENDINANSNSVCDFNAATKNYFCVKNQQ